MSVNATFKTLAALHQADFRVRHLGLNQYDKGSYILSDEDARRGSNFYGGMPELLSVVERRYHFEERKAMYSNMLRSEHIPFNFFGPLMLDPSNKIACRLFQNLLGQDVLSRVQDIKIEWAPCPKRIYLDDRSAFDAYLAGVDSNGKAIGIGIEVKYTEQSYSWGTQEKRRMRDPKINSPYHRVTRISGMYMEGALQGLATPRLKQIWRNHLLGESIVQNGCLGRFVSVLLYPGGNEHQEKVATEYASVLRPGFKDHFRAITYEQFIAVARSVCAEAKSYLDWIEYLQKRYIVRAGEPAERLLERIRIEKGQKAVKPARQRDVFD